MGKCKLHSFIALVRSTVVERYEVQAVDEDDAHQRLLKGEGNLLYEIERPDWEIESVEPNE